MNEAQAEMNEYLKQRYNVVHLSGKVIGRLIEAYTGSVHVDPTILIELFKMMESNLNTVRAKNIAMGKNMDGENLLLYDLTIVLSYYPKYEKKLNIYRKQDRERKDLEEYLKLSKNVKKNRTEDGSHTDISDVVNDIFFSEE